MPYKALISLANFGCQNRSVTHACYTREASLKGIPYIERRRQRYYLRVRTPADILALTGKRFFTKSLQTSDARHARAEAARLLAEVHTAWREMRSAVSSDDIKTRLERQRAEIERAFGEQALFDGRARAAIDGAIKSAHLAEGRYRQAERDLVRAVLDLRRGGGLAVQPPVTPPAHEDAGQPWHARASAFFEDRPSIGEASKTSYEWAFRLFKELFEDKPLKNISKSDIKSFADYLRDREINRRGQQKMSRTSIVKLLGHIKVYFAWNVSSGVLEVDPSAGVQARTETRSERDQKDQRRPFETSELKQLFDSPIFTGCHSIGRRSTPGKQVFRDEPFWYFLIALATGARTEEIAQMPSQFASVGDILCFDLKHATKTTAGPRLVPVLPELKKIGIEHWASEQNRRGRGMVQGPNASKDWSKWTNRYLDQIGLDDVSLVSYSLRHNFRQQLRAANLHPEIVDKVFGHEGETVGGGYGRPLSVDEARLVVEHVRLPVHLDHLYPLTTRKA